MKKLLKKRLSVYDVFMLCINIMPIYGVWFQGWNATEVFLVYCLETIIIGGFNVLKMLLTTIVKKKDVWTNGGQQSNVSGLFFIFFFIVHYGIFVTVQMTIFFQMADLTFTRAQPTGVFDLVINFPRYVSPAIHWLMIGFIVSYGFLVLKDYVLSGRFKTASLGVVMFEPYPRIIVQQLVVIIGGFFMALGAGKIFILVFVLIKTFFTVALDYEGMMSANNERATEAKDYTQ